jgi:hypothetical protein
MSGNFYHTSWRHILRIFSSSSLSKLEPWSSLEDSARLVWNGVGNNNIFAEQGRQP